MLFHCVICFRFVAILMIASSSTRKYGILWSLPERGSGSGKPNRFISEVTFEWAPFFLNAGTGADPLTPTSVYINLLFEPHINGDNSTVLEICLHLGAIHLVYLESASFRQDIHQRWPEQPPERTLRLCWGGHDRSMLACDNCFLWPNSAGSWPDSVLAQEGRGTFVVDPWWCERRLSAKDIKKTCQAQFALIQRNDRQIPAETLASLYYNA